MLLKTGFTKNIRAPGLYDMPAAAYHADPCETPSLNSGTANLLVSATAAHAKANHPRLWQQDGDDSSDATRLGSVVHELLLGKGGGFQVLDFKDMRSKAAQQERDAAIDVGLTPIKKADFNRAETIAETIRAKLAGMAECPGALVDGTAEVVGIWQEPTGPWCRAMYDWLMGDLSCVYDLKTTGRGLDDRTIKNNIALNGLDVQAAFYLRGLHALFPEMAGRTKWRWIFAEVEPPFELRVIEADATTLAIGGRKAVFAIDAWRRCLEADEWPGYPRTVQRCEYPQWAEAAWMEKELAAYDQGADPLGREATPVPERAGSPLVYGG